MAEAAVAYTLSRDAEKARPLLRTARYKGPC